MAQAVDVGTVQATVVKKKKVVKKAAPVAPVASAPAPAAPAPVGGAPVTSDQAIGSNAPTGSAPALAPSQASLNASEPGSVVSNKVIQDIAQPTSDYNDALKYTPGFNSSNANGSLGDTKSSWRGFKDGTFNITYDNIPFGDANNPSHHSAAYFPGVFIGTEIVDRGPGNASQVGYAPFGGTLSLLSTDFTDKAGGSAGGSYGTWGTYSSFATAQSGLVGGSHLLLQLDYEKTDGALDLGHVDTKGILVKADHNFGEVKATIFGTYSLENYNGTTSPTWAQLQQFGNTYGTLNNTNPKSDSFVDYNNSKKRTDLDYLKLEGKHGAWQWDNTLYTYAYGYPDFQNNPNNTTNDALNASAANKSTLGVVGNPVPVVNPASGCVPATKPCTTNVTFAGIGLTDATGFKQLNNYRGYGDIINGKYDVRAGALSGQARAGLWWEQVDNFRQQQYYDFTKQAYFTDLGPALPTPLAGSTAAQQAIDKNAAGYRLQLNSHITNYQPYVEYEWKPTDMLSITSGLKFESITRHHVADINQTTLQPADFSKTYSATLPSLALRYKVTPNTTVYAQASKGFLIPDVAAFYVYDINQSAIDPQQTTNYQVGVNYKDKNVTVSADAYHITATNFTTNLLDPADNKTVIGLINAGTAQYKGVEAEGTYALGNGLAVTASGSMGTAIFVDGPKTGLAINNAPRYTLAGGMVFDNGQLFGSALHKITGDQYGAQGQVQDIEVNHVGTWSQTDLVAGIRTDALKKLGLGDKVEFKLGVNNVFDNRAITDLGGSPKTNLDSTAGLTYTSQAGRNIYGSVKVDF